MSISAVAGQATTTATGVEGAIDVTFVLTIDGEEIRGECTLLPRADGRPGYAAWGSPDHWVDGRTIGELRRLYGAAYSSALNAIEEACAPRAAAFAATVAR